MDLRSDGDWLLGMAVWKEQLGGTGFGSADQPEHWAWTDRRRLMDSDALSPKVTDWLEAEVLGWLGSNGLGSEALAGKAVARRPLVRKVIATERSLPEKHWPEWNWSRRCWARRRWPEKR